MPNDPFRMLVTGSRAWTDLAPIDAAIRAMAERAAKLDRDLVVVHGHCPDGADSLARAVVLGRKRMGWRIDEEPHPANWTGPCVAACRHGARRTRRDGTEFCQSAGMHRNQEMVDLGADVCCAFIRDNSPGTSRCMKMAKAAGIEVIPMTWENRT